MGVTDGKGLVLAALAASRLTRLWTRDSLPPLPRVRHEIVQRWGDKPVAELVHCAWCAGFWVGLVVWGSSFVLPHTLWYRIVVPFALSEVVGRIAEASDYAAARAMK